MFCKECGKKISDKALACPNCGCPTDNPVSANSATSNQPSIWHYFQSCMTGKFFRFSGRATRKEYWGTILFYNIFRLLIGFIAVLILGLKGMNETDLALRIQLIDFAVVLLFAPASWSVCVRRFHDVNMSAWWNLLIIPCFIAAFVKGTEGKNKFGPAKYTVEINKDDAIGAIVWQSIFAFCILFMLLI